MSAAATRATAPRRTAALISLALLAALVATPVSATGSRAHEASATYLLRAAPGALAGAADAASGAGAKVTSTLIALDTLLLSATPRQIGLIRTRPGVLSVGADAPVHLNGYSAGADYNSLYNTGRSLGVRQAWAGNLTGGAIPGGSTGNGVDVALIDSGVTRVQGLDASGKVTYGPDFTPENTDWTKRNKDGFGHGTHMAGIIAGDDADPEPNLDNSTPFLGIAPRAGIVSVKVADAQGTTTIATVISALNWVILNRFTHGANIGVVNLSFGTDSTQSWTVDPLSFAVEATWRAGIVVVAAAGNSGNVGHLDNPASNPYVVAVGASDTKATASVTDDAVVSFSSTGSSSRGPDVVAPGKSMQSLRVSGSTIDVAYSSTGWLDTRFFRGSGTSQSAAFVSGVAALMLSKNPSLTPDEVKANLRGTAHLLNGANAAAQGRGEVGVYATVMNPPLRGAVQNFGAGTGTGSLDAAGGTYVSGKAWSGKSWLGKAWSMQLS